MIIKELSSKQRAYLRGLANTIEPIFQIGKGGINENLVQSVNDALEVRELIKLHVLDNCDGDVRELCDELTEKTNSIGVQVIGSKIVIYRQNVKKVKKDVKKGTKKGTAKKTTKLFGKNPNKKPAKNATQKPTKKPYKRAEKEINDNRKKEININLPK